MFNWEGFLIDPKIQQCTHKIQQCGDRDNFGRVKGENRKFKNMGSLKGISHSFENFMGKKKVDDYEYVFLRKNHFHT